MDWIIAIPALPILAFVLMVCLPRTVRNKAVGVSIAAIAVSMVISLVMFFQGIGLGPHEPQHVLWAKEWMLTNMGDSPLHLFLRLDVISITVVPVVTIVGLCVQVFSLGYMHGEERIGWYYAVVSLFTAAMLGFVLAGDLLIAFVSWEIMGLCSYFLIGFYFQEEEPKKASQKAFLVTRVGDLGFFFALMVIYATCNTFNLETVLATASTWAPGVAPLVAGGLLLAAMGKSAQLPLHVWLPDAMAGPTPASALIHAATMVAAGVLLIARTMPVFIQAPALMTTTLVIGLLTSIVAGLIACVQSDIKKVLAYSTVSQLGLMFVGLGVAGVAAALFHLVTHAFFKALLFLGSGYIIHSVGSQDMKDMGALRKRMPFVWITFLIGSLALAGVAPLSGFFSKDEIIAATLHADKLWAAIGVIIASVLTGFYMTRLYFKVFEGEARGECHAHRDIPMMLPLAVLSLLTLVVGWFSPAFVNFVGEHGHWPALQLIITSCLIVVAGVGAGWFLYGRKNSSTYLNHESSAYRAMERKFYFDDINDVVFVKGTSKLAKGLAFFDKQGIDGVVNGLADIAKGASSLVKDVQTGKLQVYQRLSILAVVVFMVGLVIYVHFWGV